jgi:hypothetical protein
MVHDYRAPTATATCGFNRGRSARNNILQMDQQEECPSYFSPSDDASSASSSSSNSCFFPSLSPPSPSVRIQGNMVFAREHVIRSQGTFQFWCSSWSSYVLLVNQFDLRFKCGSRRFVAFNHITQKHAVSYLLESHGSIGDIQRAREQVNSTHTLLLSVLGITSEKRKFVAS